MSEFVCSDGTRLELSTRISDKAKRQRLTLSHDGRLEVVIPKRSLKAQLQIFAVEDEAAQFVEQHRAWIERAAARTRSQREAFQMSRAAGLPTHLDFPLADELWLIEYRATTAASVSVRSAGLRRYEGKKQVFALLVTGNVEDEPLCRKALVRFVTRRAKALIPAFAQAVCAEVGARPKEITVNNRKSAWGICTAAKEIRIDRKVLFFPRDMARQVVLHEAAHLKHLDHSPQFYAELLAYPNSTREAERAVKAGIQFVPAWFLDA